MKKSVLLILIAGVLALGEPGASPPQQEEEKQSGPPVYWFEAAGDGTITHFDRDYDGIADYMITYDADGNRIYEEQDFNYDGLMDDFYFYEEGLLSRREVDSNFDGKVDLWVSLIDGIYVKGYERDADYDGVVDIVKDFGKN